MRVLSVVSRRPIAVVVAALLVAVALVLPGTAAHAAVTLTVTSNADSGTDTLRGRVAVAQTGDTIVFADGITRIDLASTIEMPKGITIQGPGADILTVGRTMGSNFTAFVIAPDDGVAGAASNQDYAFRDFRLEGRNDAFGGAIYAGYGAQADTARDVTLDGMTIADQVTYHFAVSSWRQGGDMIVTDTEFLDNVAEQTGGALGVEDHFGELRVTGSTFESNTATTDGAAIRVLASEGVVIDDSTFLRNEAGGEGGAIFTNAVSGGVEITDSLIALNSAELGGGLRVSGSDDLALSTTFFDENAASDTGGGLLVDGPIVGEVDIDSSTFAIQQYSGSGVPSAVSIRVDGVASTGSFGFRQSTIHQPADDGPALSFGLIDGTAEILNSTFYGSVEVVADIEGTFTARNSIFDTTSASDPLVASRDPLGSLGVFYNLINGPVPATADGVAGNLVDTAPNLAPLAENGGPTKTRLPNLGSAAIDAGDPAFGATPATDQRGAGFPRIAGTRIDIGAVETAPATSPVYRFWSSTKKSHFYTISITERDSVIANYDDAEWLYEGPAYVAYPSQVAGSSPLYRFWSQRYQGHFYTASVTERDAVVANYPDDEWSYEGIAYYILPTGAGPGTTSVARFWSEKNRHHFYTASATERDAVIANYDDFEWKYENDAFNVPNN